MKTNIQYLLIAAIIVVLSYQSLFQHGMLRETLQTTQKMDQQLDSLWGIFRKYEQAHLKFESAYEQLTLAQRQVKQMERDLVTMSQDQQSQVMSIQQQLRLLTRVKQETHSVPLEPVDSLVFR